MAKNNYAVTVKCGHVGRNKCVIKTIPVRAENGREAAEIARWTARVKHHAKDAILDVIKIDNEQYKLLKEITSGDPYFQCSNIQEQREKCNGIEEEIQYMRIDEIDYELREKKRKDKVCFKNKKNKIIKNDYQYMMKNYELSMSY